MKAEPVKPVIINGSKTLKEKWEADAHIGLTITAPKKKASRKA
jgi:hypothetical protein